MNFESLVGHINLVQDALQVHALLPGFADVVLLEPVDAAYEGN